MRRSRADIVDWLLARVAGAETLAYVYADHVTTWPPECVAELMRAGLLQDAGLVVWVECRRCSERCARTVHTVAASHSGKSDRYQTTCELREDVSTVSVHANRMKRWSTSRAAFARFVGACLSLRIRQPDYLSGVVSYRSGRIAQVRVAVSLLFEHGTVKLRLDNDDRPLSELIFWDVGVPQIDAEEISLWAKEIGAKRIVPVGYLPSRRKQLRRKRKYEERNNGWQALAEDLKAANPSQKRSAIAQAIFVSGKWAGVTSSQTIERVIRVPKNPRRKKVASTPLR